MRSEDAISREIRDNLSRSHRPSLAVVRCFHFLCAAGFLFGLYRVVTDPASAVGYLVVAVSVLFYSRVVMGYRYWMLVEWVRRNGFEAKGSD